MAGAEQDPFRIVGALEMELATKPDGRDLRQRLALALEAATVAARSQTRDQRLVMTSARQLDVCERAARRILELGVDDPRLIGGAQALLAEIEVAHRWVWQQQGRAFAYLVTTSILGLTVSVVAGLSGNIALLVAGALVSSVVSAAVVLRHRRQWWRIVAEQMRLVIWRPGI